MAKRSAKDQTREHPEPKWLLVTLSGHWAVAESGQIKGRIPLFGRFRRRSRFGLLRGGVDRMGNGPEQQVVGTGHLRVRAQYRRATPPFSGPLGLAATLTSTALGRSGPGQRKPHMAPQSSDCDESQ